MASKTVIAEPVEHKLSADEGWELILTSFGTARDLYAEYGGGEAWLRAERESWGEEPAR